MRIEIINKKTYVEERETVKIIVVISIQYMPIYLIFLYHDIFLSNLSNLPTLFDYL